MTSYNVETGTRDMNILKFLQHTYGHPNLGVYAQAIDGGVVSTGDALEVLSLHDRPC